MKLDEFDKNFYNTYIKPYPNYKFNKITYDDYKITHVPTKSFVKFTTSNYNMKGASRHAITEGENPNNARGFGIGIRLRALATVYAILANKPISHEGVRKNIKQEKRNLPASTTLLRKYLGFTKHRPTNINANHFAASIYRPGSNNNRVKAAAITNKFNKNVYTRRLAKKITASAINKVVKKYNK